MNGNTHKPYNCPFCWLVLYSKGALTHHLNDKHWDMKEAEDKEEAELELEVQD